MGSVTLIYVSTHLIGKADARPITVERDGVSTSARRVEILGPSVLEYRPDSPLEWGAKCYLTIPDDVEVLCD